MNELLKELNDGIGGIQRLAITLTNAVNYAHNITNEADAKLKSVESKEKVLEDLTEKVATRERAVSHIEDVVKLEKDVKAVSIALESVKEKLAKDMADFENYRKVKIQELDAITAKQADDQSGLDRGWAKLRQAEADLEKKLAKYKELLK
jgi:Glu-tRNA(Gln) amidotransferase subunit E-like FAD-binding protein